MTGRGSSRSSRRGLRRSATQNAIRRRYHLRSAGCSKRSSFRRQGAQALPGRVQAESGAARSARRGALHLLGPRQDQHGAEAPRARAEEHAGRAADDAICSSSSATCSATRATTRRRRRRTRVRSASRQGKNDEARACLEDVQVDESTWQERVAALLARGARRRPSAAGRGSSPRRAHREALRARGSRGAARAGLRGGSRRTSRPRRCSKRCWSRRQRTHAILERAAHVLASIERPARRARAALRSGSASAGSTRHQNVELGVELLEESLEYRSRTRARSRTCASSGAPKKGNWDRVLDSPRRRAQDQNGSSPFMLAQAGDVAWRQLGNLMRARGWFERLSAIAPEHPSLQRVRGADRRASSAARRGYAGAEHRARSAVRRTAAALGAARHRRRPRPSQPGRAGPGSRASARRPASRRARASRSPRRPSSAAAVDAGRRRRRRQDRRAPRARREARSKQALQRVRQDAHPARGDRRRTRTRRSRSTRRPPSSTRASSRTRPRR